MVFRNEIFSSPGKILCFLELEFDLTNMIWKKARAISEAVKWNGCWISQARVIWPKTCIIPVLGVWKGRKWCHSLWSLSSHPVLSSVPMIRCFDWLLEQGKRMPEVIKKDFHNGPNFRYLNRHSIFRLSKNVQQINKWLSVHTKQQWKWNKPGY